MSANKHPRTAVPFVSVDQRLALLASERITITPCLHKAAGVGWTWIRPTSDDSGECGDTFDHLEDALHDAERQLSERARAKLAKTVVMINEFE
jgi:hypothetical protein